MAKWGNADYEQLKALQERLQKLARVDLDKFCMDVSKELAARLLSFVIPATPLGKYPNETGKKGGTLRRGWTAKSHEDAASGSGQPTASQAKEYAQNLPISKSGGTYTIEVINPVEYASYVEFGHRQQPGRYVPAIGKRLKAGWVNGQYFLTLSEDDLERIAPALLEKKLNELLREVFNG